ncbi:MAG: ribosome small subunit-dependent GTPase A [Anaerolineae bacterium]|nr:ribosome small subunit-dependent GTPase A [Anaerolineae bacterium]
MLRGLVVKEQSGFFWVEASDQTTYVCRLRGRLMEEAQSADIAAIGDVVWIEVVEPGVGTVETVEERRNSVARAVRTEGLRGGGAPERQHVIIANADQAFFVFAAVSPAPNTYALDRFLVMGEKAEIDPLVIIVNKIDLADGDEIEAKFAPYRAMGYDLLMTSALHGTGIAELRERLAGRVSVFTGPSGVGKTSLLNCIQPNLGRAVKSVSQRNQEGMHTTRDSELIKLEAGGYVADTPGIRTLTVWDVEPEELDAYFREIAAYVGVCRFGDCTHRSEPGCAVRKAVEKGVVAEARYVSYQRLRAELEAAYALN